MSDNEYLMPLPLFERDSVPFWEGCRNHELLLQRCVDCARYRYPPRPMCPDCGSMTLSWQAVSGRGEVYSWMIVHHPVHPGVAGKVPYNVVLVELEEGVRVVSNIVGLDDLSLIKAGMPVEVIFDDVTADVTLPRFRVRT